MALQQQGRGAAVAGQPGNQIGTVWGVGQNLVLDACIVQQSLDVLDPLGFIARRIGGVETHQLLGQRN